VSPGSLVAPSSQAELNALLFNTRPFLIVVAPGSLILYTQLNRSRQTPLSPYTTNRHHVRCGAAAALTVRVVTMLYTAIVVFGTQ
jgi:hypothetical protein